MPTAHERDCYDATDYVRGRPVMVSMPFRRGLSEGGFVEGRNVAIEYRFADGQYERLAALAAEFVRRPVSLIVGAAPPAALAAKVVTTTIPIVFIVGLDPIAAGLVIE
jgi:ABC-type uncharacterized transport system substrate-binding protein